MKSKLSILGLFSLLFFLSSCQKNDFEDNFPLNAKLKQILLVSSFDSKEPINVVEEYEYDDAGRISKVSTPMYNNGKIVGTIRYDVYEYNSSGQLIKINNYNSNINSPTGFINLKNTLYEYSPDGKKLQETIEYPLGGISEYTVFEYKNGLLIKTSEFSGNKLERYIVYEYDNSDRAIKELSYGFDGQCVFYTIHSYTGSLQTKSEIYNFSTNSNIRTINRIFDKNKNIITLESKELSLVSSLASFVLRYEYYK